MSRTYEAGVDRVVIYPPAAYGPPVSWNGVVKISEDFSSLESTPLYFDGAVRLVDQAQGDYKATLQAFTYPTSLEWLLEDQRYGNTPSIVDGQLISAPVSLTYRTTVYDENGFVGYKIHLIQDVYFSAAPMKHETTTNLISPEVFEWTLTAIPPKNTPARIPSNHVILETSLLPELLVSDLNDMLYGTATAAPYFIDIKSVSDWVVGWNRFTIIDNGDGTWSAYVRDADLIFDAAQQLFTINNIELVSSTSTSYTVQSQS